MSNAKAKKELSCAGAAHAALPHFKNPNTNWPFMYSIKPACVLVNMAQRGETTKQRLNKMEEARW